MHVWYEWWKMAFKEGKPLLHFENDRQLTLPLKHNEDNTEKFWKAIQIWILKPQVADRRILSSLILDQRVLNRSDLKGDMSDFEDSIQDILSACSSDSVREAVTNLADVDMTKVLLLVTKVLPRQSEHMAPCHELIVADFKQLEVFFIRLESGSKVPHFPEDVSQTWSYKVSYNSREQEITITLSPFYENHHPATALPEFTPPTQKWLFDTLLPKLVKWTNEVDPAGLISARKSIISMERYSDVHRRLKLKYAEKFVQMWDENTDPLKFVYEDISIAAFLIVLWEEERQRLNLGERQSFVDLGCGNGLLVHILNSEGHPGKGLDLRKRKIWDRYGPGTNLEEHTIVPTDLRKIQGFDWLIGNHSDELTPWIPVMAFRSSVNTRYFVLPCCFYDFYKKFSKADVKVTQYRSYLNFIQEVGETSGYEVQEDSMRIPSTKRICQVGFKCISSLKTRGQIEEAIQDYIAERCLLSKLDSIKQHSEEDIKSAVCEIITNSAVPSLEGQWRTKFEPRQKEELVRNCSKLEEPLKDMIVMRVFNAVMDADKTDVVQDIKRMKTEEINWKRGGNMTISEAAGLFEGETLKQLKSVITISEAARLFEGETLKQLKSECGGLKTLLKNFYPVFLLRGDEVRLRDWSDLEESRPQSSIKNRAKDQAKREEKFKTRLCWFHLNHPDGCPRDAANCLFAHGDGDLRELPSQIQSMAI